MIASTHMAVLPVVLSPIINSLCPLPIGIMASIALMPVCTGVSTDFLMATFGATISTSRVSFVSTGPLPSIGDPIPSTTLPKSSSPTGTCITLPVPRTSVPSLMPRGSPRMTIPTLSSSRFRAIPATPPSNSTSSL